MATPRVLRMLSTRAGARQFSTTIRQRDQIPFNISGSGTGVAQVVQVDNSSHTIKTDAYVAFGGADLHPSPLHFNLTALSSCTQVTGAIVAKDHGVTIDSWDVKVEGKLDPSVLVAGKDDNGNGGNWNAIHLAVKVKSKTDSDKFKHWASEVERRCPVTQLFKKSGVQWTSEWSQQ